MKTSPTKLKYPILSFIVFLSGCVTTQPIPEKVYIRVPAPCIEADKAPKLPTVTQDAELAKQSDFDLVISIAADRIALRQYAKEADAAIAACTK